MNGDAFPRRHGKYLALVSLLCFVIVYFAWYPGVYTQDELDIFNQSLHANRHDGHSPLLVAMWSITNSIKLGPALPYLIGLSATIAGCAMLCARIAPRPFFAPLMLCMTVALPPVFSSLGLVTKDIFLVAAMLAVLNALAAYAASPTRSKMLWLTGLLQLAVLIRLDAIFALFPLLVYLAWVDLTRRRKDRITLRVLSFLIAVAMVLILATVSRLTGRYVFQTTPYNAEQVSMLFDLSAISVQSNQMLIPTSRLEGNLGLPEIRARFNPALADNLIWSPDNRHLVYKPSANHVELHTAWWHAITTYPLAYLRFRIEYAARFIGLRNNVPYMRAQFQADESMNKEPQNGWKKTGSPLQQMYFQFSETTFGQYVFLPWTWLIAALIPLFGFSTGILGRQAAPASRILPQLFILSALSYTVLMSCISAASLARYHSWPRIAIGMALAAAVLDIIMLLRSHFKRS